MKMTINRKDGMSQLTFNDVKEYAKIELYDKFFWVKIKGGKAIQYVAIDTISDIFVEED